MTEIEILRRDVAINRVALRAILMYLGGPKSISKPGEMGGVPREIEDEESVEGAISRTPLSGSHEHEDTPF